MKKLILAPAVALAFAGVAAAPVAAAEPTTETQNEQSAEKKAKDQASAPAEESKPTAEEPKETPAPAETEEPKAEKPTETPEAETPEPSPEPSEDTGNEAGGNKDDNTEDSADEADKDKKEDAKAAGTFTLSTTEISVSDMKDKGITVSGSDFAPGAELSVDLKHSEGGAEQATPVTADENGSFNVTVTSSEELPSGDYAVIVSGEGVLVGPETLTLTEDAPEEIDASLKVDPTEITAKDLADENKGFVVTVSGLLAGDTVTDSLTGKDYSVEKDGSLDIGIFYDGDPANIEPGKVPFTVTVEREGVESQTLNGEITVIEEPEAPVDPSLTVSPKSIEAADFVNKKKGVKLSVENCEPGSKVTFKVNPKGLKVTAFESTETADDEGKASVSVHGITSNTSAYVGDYTVTAVCGDDTMSGAFSVTGGAKGGGGNSDDGDNNGNDEDVNSGGDLPRTGADLGGLTTGAILLLVGGAAVALTGRRKKTGTSPSAF